MSDAFLRLLLLLHEIPTAPRRIDTSALADQLLRHGVVVTRRTLQRDLGRIARILPLRCDHSKKPYGWSWEPDAPSALPVVLGRLQRSRPTNEVNP